MGSKKRDRSWPPADAVAPLAVPVTDNHTHLPVAADAGGQERSRFLDPMRPQEPVTSSGTEPA